MKCILGLLAICYFTQMCHGNSGEVMGCGGFVKSSKSNIDLSRIHIGLFEKRNGNLRKVEATDCAPNNGYYFLPVSPDDRGSYVLKALPPRGWKIEPSEYSLNIDGDTDQCSKGIDLNFEFIGFGITGSVLSKGSKSGPKDIQIELLSKDSKEVLRSAVTDLDGKYDFFGVTPGDYLVRVSNEFTKTLALDADSRKIYVGEDVGEVEPFTIMGYSIEGQVLGADSSPHKGISFKLVDVAGKILGQVTSDQTGSIKFTKVPAGDYIVGLNDKMKDSIELTTNQQAVEVGHDNVILKSFQVKSFKVKGKVMSGNKPLKNVKLILDNKEHLISGPDGTFELKSGPSPITIKAALEGYDFDALTIEKLHPGMDLPTLKPSRFRLSGKVDRAGFMDEITVKFKDESQETIGKVSVTEKGQFSIYLPAAEYSVQVEVATSEQAKIGFAPLQHKAKVIDAPVQDLNFHAIKADIEGQVHCLNDCGSSLEIMLSLENGLITKSPVVKGQFKFSGVLPATYTLSITEDGKCWEESVKKVSVSTDIKDILFKQIGHHISVTSTRSTLLLIQDSKSQQEVIVSAGKNVICVKSKDKQVALATKGCEEFEIMPETLSFDHLENVSLKAIKYTVSGKVINKNNEKMNDLKVTAKSETRQVELNLEKVEAGIYGFNLMAYPGEEIIFLPSSSDHLFDPESLHVFVDHDCHLEVAIFNANKGHFVKGQITPPVENVKVVISNKDSAKVVVETTTDKSGKYKVGPLPSQAKYTVEVSKEGYVFEQTDNGFKSKKLASISVQVQDNAGQDLNGVVISVAGGSDNFRSNTKSENGQAEFLSLAPGEYFIKPQLKEYEFKPKHKMQKIGEGENAQISWQAKRVAFSIFGKLVSLNGQAEPGTTLRATSKTCPNESNEEATSEQDGSLRFRGLKPGCEYVITLLHGDNIEKIIPAQVKVVMTEKDINLEKPIVAMRSFETMDVLLKVTDDASATQTNLKINVKAKDFNYHTKALTGQLVTLPRVAKDGKKYEIHVESIPGKFAPMKQVFHSYVADDYVKSIKLVLNKTDQSVKQSRKVSGLVYLLPFIVGGILSYVLWEQRPQFVKNLLESSGAGQASNPSHNSRRASDDQATLNDGWEVVSATPSGAKRRNKKR